MRLINAEIYRNGKTETVVIDINDGVITAISDKPQGEGTGELIDLKGALLVPGAVDVHVHLREPGFADKETVKTATRSAAKGGVTCLMAMPNTVPTPDNVENFERIEATIARDALVRVFPFGSVTVAEKGEELADIEGLSKYVKAFSDDGKCVNNLELLELAMRAAKAEGKIIASHAEAKGAETPAEAEYTAVKRELELVKKTGVKYHFCHLSTTESLEAVKKAQAEGADVTCEVTPHHLTLCDKDIAGNPNFKMNPPLAITADMIATEIALAEGTATMVATDHAPHTEAEKALPYADAPNGIIGLETLFPVVYSFFLGTGRATIGDLINWITVNPATRFGLPYGKIEVGGLADLAALDLKTEREYTKEEIVSKGKNSPFIGKKFIGFPVLTILGGKIIYNSLEVE